MERLSRNNSRNQGSDLDANKERTLSACTSGCLARPMTENHGREPDVIPKHFQPAVKLVPAASADSAAMMEQFKSVLSEQLQLMNHGQHASLETALKSLRKDLFEFIQREVETVRKDITTSNGHPSSHVRVTEKPFESEASKAPREGSKDSGFKMKNPDVQQDDELPEFKNHPDLRAFMAAKNWTPPKQLWLAAEAADAQPGPKDNCLQAKLRKIVEATWFDLLIGSAILINAVVMALSLEFDARKTAEAIGLENDGGSWPGAEIAFLAMDHIFTLFFLCELCMKLIVYCRSFFTSGWNLMDFVIVLAAVFETYIAGAVKSKGPNMGFMRLMRIVKMVKVLRVVRVLDAFTHLRIMLVAIVASAPALMWSMALLGVVQLIASIFMTQILQSFLMDDNNEQETREAVYQYFGSFSRTAMSMIEMTLAPGTASRFARLLTYEVNGAFWVFIFVYAACVSFALIKVITALFLKETLNAAAKDNETVMAEVNRNPQFVIDVRRVFDEFDGNKNGYLSADELDEVLGDRRSEPFLKLLGITPYEASGLFSLMDDGDDEITFAEFLVGVMRLKSKAQIDLVSMLYENKRILTKICQLEKTLQGNDLNSTPKSGGLNSIIGSPQGNVNETKGG